MMETLPNQPPAESKPEHPGIAGLRIIEREHLAYLPMPTKTGPRVGMDVFDVCPPAARALRSLMEMEPDDPERPELIAGLQSAADIFIPIPPVKT